MSVVRANPRLIGAFHARFARLEQAVTEGLAGRLGVDPAQDRRPRLLAGVLGTVMRSSLEHRRDRDPDADLPDLVAESFDLLVACITG